MSAFYANPAIRRRLAEYLGGDASGGATAVYVTRCDGCLFKRSELHPPEYLGKILDLGLDVARSLADRESLLFHLDIEYVDFDLPLSAHESPAHAFEMQQPTVRVIEQLLLGWGITPLHFITGQGHHFVWRVGNASAVGRRIAALDPDPVLSHACHLRSGRGTVCEIGTAMQGQFAATALVMEYLAGRIKWMAAPLSALPVEVTAVSVGPGASRRREMVSIDISEYGDPLHTRMIRMPYSNYLKPWLGALVADAGAARDLACIKTIPLFEMDVHGALACRHDEAAVRELALRANSTIPLQEAGTARLLDEYLSSGLRLFHEDYYSLPLLAEVDAPIPDVMPPCGADLLQWPNDRLLKPAGIQLVTRLLLAHGWHPRRIAGLIRSRFENADHAWGVDWTEYDPGMRADFYTRLCAGLWKTGVDRLVDFNCVSTWEKGFCPAAHHAGCSLNPSRDILLKSIAS